jgi:DNA-binding NarL/FixJ family response regulator
MTIRVLLVDDHAMFREALRHLLNKEPEIEVVGEFGDGTGIAEAITQLAVDVVVMDVNMPNINGIDATRSLISKFPQLRIVALSAYGYKQFVMEMMDAGAIAYVVKSAAGEQLVRAISSAFKGEAYLCPETTATLIASSHADNSATKERPQKKRNLGQRETEVLRLLAQGKSSPQIGIDLHIAPSTVDVHRRNIMDKLDLHSVAELTKYAIRTGLSNL